MRRTEVKLSMAFFQASTYQRYEKSRFCDGQQEIRIKFHDSLFKAETINENLTLFHAQ
jgi:hypothetical protein